MNFLTFIARNLDGLNKELKSLPVVLEVGGEATLVTDGGGVQAVLLVDQLLEVVVQLAAHPHRLGEAGGASGQNHELLEEMSSTGFIQTTMLELMTNLHGELVASVAATVDDVEARNWHKHVLHLEENKIKIKTMKNKKKTWKLRRIVAK